MLDVADAESGQRQAQAQLKARRDGRRQGAGDASHQSRGAGDQEEGSDDQTRAGDSAWSHRLDQDRGRGGLHRLHRHRQAVETSGGRIEQAEGHEDAGGVHPHHRDRADDVGQEGAEIAERAGHLVEVPRESPPDLWGPHLADRHRLLSHPPSLPSLGPRNRSGLYTRKYTSSGADRPKRGAGFPGSSD